MVKISACVIVKNEEENLPYWLKNMNKIADEIIIVDTGSSDNTKKIASASSAKVYDFKWCDNFAAAKNFALTMATGDWILFLDADEYFDADDIAVVRQNIEALNKNNTTKVIMFECVNIEKKSKKIRGRMYLIRGMKNDPLIRYKGKVHEQLFYNNEEITDIAVIPEVLLYHTGYSEIIVEDKLRRNLKIMQDDIKDNGDKPRYYGAMADCYYGLGEYDNAVIWARKFIDSGLVALGGEKQVYYTLLAAMQKAQYPSEELDAYLLKAMEKFPNDKILLQERQALLMTEKNIFISACVIVKNEEKNIEDYIKNIKRIVDEIIVVDTGSDDNTVELAKNNGANVYYFKWCDDFAAAKNFALDKAKGKWILFLDADEYFKETCVDQLIEYVKEYDNTKIEALTCKFLNIDCDKDNKILSSFYQLRLFRNDKNIRYKGQIHEALYKINNEKIEMVVLPDDIEVIHTGYSSSIMQEKTERNLALLQKEIDEKGEEPQHYYYLADCYYSLGDYEKTIYYSKKFIDSDLQMIGAETNIYTRLIDSLSLAKYPINEIISAIELAIEKFPEIPDFYFMKSFFLLQKKDYQEAEKYLKCCFKYWHMGEVKITLSVMEHLSKYIYLVAGIIAEVKDLPAEAINFYIKGLKKDKYNGEILDHLYNLVQKKPAKLVINIFNKIYSANDRDYKFIINILNKYQLGEVQYYYKKKSNIVTQQEIQFVSKQYNSVATDVKNELADCYKKIMLNCLENLNKDRMKTVCAILPNEYINILENAYQHFDGKNYNEDISLCNSKK